jgi:hypothetical protein
VPAVFTVNSLADVAPGAFNPADKVVTLREAVERADALAGADTIRFAPGLKGTIALAHGQLEVTDDLTVVGPGASRIAVSGGGLSRVLFVEAGVTAAVSGLTIRDGLAPEFGGGIFNEGDLTLTGCRVAGNTAVSDGGDTTFGGGGIENRGSLTLWGCRVEGNTLVGTQEFFEDIDNGGGGINNNGGDLSIYYSTISGNQSFNGGGIRSSQGTFTLVGSVVSGNTGAGIVGGGMALVLSVNHISNSVFADNHMVGDFGSGGAFSNDSSITTLVGCVFAGNSATGFGGAVVIASVQEGGESSVTADGCAFTGHEALIGGAFAVVDGSSLTLDDSYLGGNQAAADGGAIWVGNFLDDFGLFFGNCDVTITDSALVDNSAGGNGGGIYLEVADTLVLNDTLVTLNSAGGAGGGLYVEETPAVFDVSDAVIVLNDPDNVFIAP